MYPAKILLFGEHTVLQGGQALAVPYPNFRVNWQMATEQDDRLLQLLAYLRKTFTVEDFDFTRLEAELNAGWQLVGNVAGGYGVGSSGTVCAAVFDRYAQPKATLNETRAVLASMEGFYHGKSSGTDPLISLLKTPLLLGGGKVDTAQLRANWQQGLFLLDSGISREAEPLIDRFAEQYQNDDNWRNTIQSEWMVASQACIEYLIGGNNMQFADQFSSLSATQYALAPWLIPESIQRIWSGSTYDLKICGAGGGGFMLGYSHDWPQTQRELNHYTLYKV